MSLTRRHALLAGAAGSLVLPRFAIGQADNRPSITIAVQKVANSNTLDVLREQSNVGERVFFSSLWEGLIGRNWQGSLETVPLLATSWRRIDDRTVGDGRPGPITMRLADAYHRMAVERTRAASSFRLPATH